MKTTVSLGICVLCCLVALHRQAISFWPARLFYIPHCALIAAEAFGYETTGDTHSTATGTTKNERNLVKPTNYGAGTNNLEPVLEYVPNDLAVYKHQHEKRETLTQPSGLETLQSSEPQQHLRGRRLPFYVEEPRKSDPSTAAAALEKRELSIKQMLAGSDYFVPNRGKKRVGSGISKKVKFDDILGSGELFIPNRGKKELIDLFSSSFGSGRMLNNLQPVFSKKNVLNAMQNVGSKEDDNGDELFFPTRGKKNVLENLAQSQDTFFSSRGKRNPVIWSILNEELSPWEFLTADDSSYDADFDRYQTNKIIT